MAQEGGDEGRRLGPGQGRAGAEVDSAAEGEVPVAGAAGVEAAGATDGGRIGVRRPDEQVDDLPLPHGCAADLGGGHRVAGGDLDGRVPAQGLLDEAVAKVRVSAEPVPVQGLGEQDQGQVRQEGGAGHDPGVEQREQAEPEVGSGVTGPAGEETLRRVPEGLAEERQQLAGGDVAVRELVPGPEDLARAGDPVGEPHDARRLAGRQPGEAGEDDRREDAAQVRGDVRRVPGPQARGEPRDLGVHQFLDEGRLAEHRPGGERRGERAAAARVFRRVLLQQGVAHGDGAGAGAPVRAVPVPPAAVEHRQRPVRERAADVVVPGHEQRAPDDGHQGTLPAKPGVEGSEAGRVGGVQPCPGQRGTTRDRHDHRVPS